MMRRWSKSLWVLVAFALSGPTVVSAGELGAVPAALSLPDRRTPYFGDEPASTDVRRVAVWIMNSGDNHALPFIVVDKVQAKVFVFDRDGQLLGASAALLGLARGDDSAPGIGSRRLAAIRPDERTTPAGRFVASMGRDIHYDVLWIDYSLSLSMHRVITGNRGDHRLQRLATSSPLDKRISYGCINVPVRFYEQTVLKTFTGTRGIVYILPEVKALQDVFPLGTR